MFRPTTLAVFASVATLAAAAQEPPKPGDPAKVQAELQQRILQQFDANRDGVLSDQERLIAQEAMRRKGLPPMGIAPGGFPDADRFLKAFDKDGDGKLSDIEKAAAQAAYQRLRAAGRGASVGGPPQIGGAGTVPASPLLPAASPAAGGEPSKDKVSPLVKRFDKDGDGKLNAEEKAAAQAALKKKSKPSPKGKP